MCVNSVLWVNLPIQMKGSIEKTSHSIEKRLQKKSSLRYKKLRQKYRTWRYFHENQKSWKRSFIFILTLSDIQQYFQWIKKFPMILLKSKGSYPKQTFSFIWTTMQTWVVSMSTTKKIRGISIKNQSEKSREIRRVVTSWINWLIRTAKKT